MQVGLIGAGNMARALALGWGEPVLASDSGSGRARALVAELGGEALRSNAEVAEHADVVVLCHKPRQFVEVSREIEDKVSIVASVLGGVSVENLQKAYPGAHAFRLMPNTPVAVRHGIICYAPADGVDKEIEARVIGLFERLGIVVRVEEQLIEVAAAVMSVGPAYVALLAEAQVDAAVRNGLKPNLASRLTAETMSGTAALLATRDYDTLAVRREVTSPAGSTARGLAALERGGVRTAFQDAMDAVLARSDRR
jgi:pyrroline-5-carboxylate reductase